MSYKNPDEWRKKYRSPKEKCPDPDLLLRGSNNTYYLLFFQYYDNGEVEVVNNPPNLVWNFDPDTGELTVTDYYDTNVIFDFIYGDDIGHVLREIHGS